MTQENKSNGSYVFIIVNKLINNEQFVPGTVLSALYLVTTLILTITL